MADFVITYYALYKYKEDERILIKALALWREILGDKYSNIITSIADLAVIYYAFGKYEDVEGIKVEALALQWEILSNKHPNTI